MHVLDDDDDEIFIFRFNESAGGSRQRSLI